MPLTAASGLAALPVNATGLTFALIPRRTPGKLVMSYGGALR
jgi:hypothetical protein